MKIYFAADHAGHALKQALLAFARERGWEAKDCGARAHDEADDYPDVVGPLARAVAADAGSFGVVIGKSGHGEAMAANRARGARAALLCGDDARLALSREHNDANILAIGADFTTPEQAIAAIERWVGTPFSGDERHARRIKKLDDL